jgi:hypothetical protein
MNDKEKEMKLKKRILVTYPIQYKVAKHQISIFKWRWYFLI